MRRADTAALMEETPFLLNNAKRKLRLVLSTTDLHTADFRHTSVSFEQNQSNKLFRLVLFLC